MKITRIITYEGSEEALARALGMSRCDGIMISGFKDDKVKMSILTVGNRDMLEIYKNIECKDDPRTNL